MKINFKAIGKLVNTILVASVPAIGQVEQTAIALKNSGRDGLSNEEKKALALDFIRSSVQAAEGVTDSDLIDDGAVMSAAGNVVDAVHNLHVVVDSVKKAKAAPVQAPA